jgi:peptide deformylase
VQVLTVRPILKYPHPALRSAAEPVDGFGDDLRMLVQDLLETMRAAPGIGITAPHIGVLKRIVVLELDRGQPVRFYVNPEIEWFSADTVRHEEGSVSMPGVSDEVERPASIQIRYQNLSGEPQTEEATGLLSICLQHEIDQLDGTFWIYRLSKLKRDRLIKRYEKLSRSQR